MGKFVWGRSGPSFLANEGEEMTTEQVAAYAGLELASELETLQRRIEAFTDTYNHYEVEKLRDSSD